MWRPGYLEDNTAKAHSVDSEIFNAVIYQSARSMALLIY